MVTLAHQLDDLIETHGLSSIGITRIARPDGECFWSINVQGDGMIGTNNADRSGGPGHGIKTAIMALDEQRRVAPIVPELVTAA